MNTVIHFTLALALFGASAAVDAQAQAGEPQVPTRHERQHLGHGYDPGAQPHPYRSQRYSRHPDQYGYWDHRRYRSTQPQDHGFRMRHRPDGNNEEQARRRFQSPGLYAPPPGYYPYHWSRGQHLPPDWYGLAYRLDHHAYGLLAPPPGHHWVRVDNDVFMVALDSGLIVDGVHDLFH